MTFFARGFDGFATSSVAPSAAGLNGPLLGGSNTHWKTAPLHGAPIPARFPPDTLLFEVPDKLSKILNRDLKLAGIAKRDERGRTLDVHALRHTFGTLLSKVGVAPRTAQAAMRQSKIDLTMNVYTDPKLLDVRGVLAHLRRVATNRISTVENERSTDQSR